MAYSTLLFDVRDNVATITLNRSGAANAMTRELTPELADAALRCDADPNIRAVVITGAGYLDISVKPSPTVRPRWFILYNGLEPFQHRKWHCRSDVERGVVKWLHMAGGYGRLRYQPWY